MQSNRPIEYGCSAVGHFRNICVVNKAGQVVRRLPDQRNLILDCGLDLIANMAWATAMTYGVAGTGTTDTREVVTGNYSQAGTTVTRDSGARDFTSGDVGKVIRFSTGETAKISAFIGATSVTVVESQTVASTSITLYHVNQIELATEVVRSNTYPAFTMPDGLQSQDTQVTPATGKVMLRRTFDFPEEVGSVTYTELGVSWSNTTSAPGTNWGQSGTTVSRSTGTGTVTTADIGKIFTFSTGEKCICVEVLTTTSFRADRSQTVTATTMTAKAALFSRVKLAVPISLVAGEQLRFTYDLTLTVSGVTGVTTTTETGESTGWPIPYNVTGITTNGVKMVVTTSAAHHFVVGSKVNLAGIVMPRKAITAASSTGSDFTITSAGHGYTAGNSIVIQGVTPAGYNGTWTIASVTTDTITVTSALNPGTGTVFGTVRLANPSPWFDGEWTVAAVPTTTTFEVTTAITPAAPQMPEGTASGNVRREFRMIKGGITPINYAAGTNMARAMAGGYTGVSDNFSNNILDGSTGAGQVIFQVTPTFTVFPNKWPATWLFTNATDHLGVSAGSGLSSSDVSDAGVAVGLRAAMTLGTYSTGSFQRDTTALFTAGQINSSSHKIFGFSSIHTTGRGVAALIIFEELQKKEATHKLTFTIRRRWSRDLTVEP